MVNSDFLPLEVRTKKCVIFLLFFSLAHEKKFLFKDHSVFVNQKKTLHLEFYSSQKDAYNIYSLCSCSNAVYPWIKPHFFLFFCFFVFLVMCHARIIVSFLPPNWLDIWLPFQNDTKKKFHWLMTLLQLILSFSF